jgi:hypothetical protein
MYGSPNHTGLARFMFERQATTYDAEPQAMDYWWGEEAVKSFWMAEAWAVMEWLMGAG